MGVAMLDLSIPARTVAGIDLAGDSEDPFAFYVLPAPPHVVLRDGEPAINLLRFVSNGSLTGGYLSLDLELSYPQSVLDAAVQQLRATLNDHQNRVTLRPIPAVDSSAELMFVGQETDSDGAISALLSRSYGRVTPSLMTPFSASFSLMLNADGAKLVEAAMRSGGAPIGAIFRLTVEGLRPAQRIVASVDWSRVYEHFSSEFTAGSVFAVEDIQKLSEKLVERNVVTIQAVQAVAADAGAPPPDLGPALEWIQREIVERCCEPMLSLSREPAHASLGAADEIFGIGSAFAVKPITEIEHDVSQIDFRRDLVVKRTLTAQAHLKDFGGASVDKHISDADLHNSFFDRVSLHLETAQPLASCFVSELVAQFTYGAAQVPIRLTPTAADGRAEAWADQASNRTWTLPVEITLAPDAPFDAGARVQLGAFSGQGAEMKLDLAAALGLRSIDFQATPDDRVVMANIALQQLRAGKAVGDPHEAILASPAARQTIWLRGYQPGDRFEMTLKYLLKDDRMVQLAPSSVDTRTVRLPPAFPGTLTVQVFSDDDWSELDHVSLTIQKTPDAQASTFLFDKPGMAIAVDLEMPDPTDRTYRYKVSRFLADGTEEDDDWITSDRSSQLVGRVAGDMLVVDVVPVGPELPAAGVSLIEVALQYVDAANQILNNPTAVIRAHADKFHWVVPLKNPALTSYEYQVTVHRASGATEVGKWTTSTDRILPIPVTQG
jgi:hypothetical protein